VAGSSDQFVMGLSDQFRLSQLLLAASFRRAFASAMSSRMMRTDAVASHTTGRGGQMASAIMRRSLHSWSSDHSTGFAGFTGKTFPIVSAAMAVLCDEGEHGCDQGLDHFFSLQKDKVGRLASLADRLSALSWIAGVYKHRTQATNPCIATDFGTLAQYLNHFKQNESSEGPTFGKSWEAGLGCLSDNWYKTESG
jgi:hypothetical protein